MRSKFYNLLVEVGDKLRIGNYVLDLYKKMYKEDYYEREEVLIKEHERLSFISKQKKNNIMSGICIIVIFIVSVIRLFQVIITDISYVFKFPGIFVLMCLTFSIVYIIINYVEIKEDYIALIAYKKKIKVIDIFLKRLDSDNYTLSYDLEQLVKK